MIYALPLMNTFDYGGMVCTAIAFVAVLSALLVITQAVRNPVNAVLWLIVAFVAVACYLITAGMTFLGLSYIIVYVGAIAVLFLFVVMMLNLANQNLAGQDTQATLSRNKMWPLAIIILGLGTITVLPLYHNITFVGDLPFAALDAVHAIFYGDGLGTFNAVYDTPGYSELGLENVAPFNQVQILGMTLYTYGALWLMIISVLLMLAMIVPLALAFT